MSGRTRVVVLTDEVIEVAAEDHLGVQQDRRRREQNVSSDKELCERCDGTGNEFFFMYSRCRDCDGLGFVSKGFD